MPPEFAIQGQKPVETAIEPHVLAIAPFAKWTYEDAHKAMQEILPEDYSIIAGYVVDKDHFQKGTEWVGPGDAKVNTKIQEQFAPEDAIGEVLANIENAFSNPQLGGTPMLETGATEEDVKALLDELLPILEEWWHTQRMQEHIQENQRTAAWVGWADLRLWIPHRFLIKDGNNITVRPASSIEEALRYIHVMAPQPKFGAIITDLSTMDKVAVFLDVEVEYGDNDKRTDFSRAELVYLDPDRENDEDAETIMRIVYSNKEKDGIEARLELGGRLMMAEMRTPVLITDPVIRTQRQLNLLTTIVTRIGETAAFRERYTLNAKPQGIRIRYEEGDTLADGAFLERDGEGREWAVIPQPRTLGASTTTELVGLPLTDTTTGDAKGNTTPGIEIVDPVDPGPYILAADAVRRRILRMCAQGHLGGASNQESSGIAYEQARAVFEKDLEKRKTSQEGQLRQLITAAIALAENLSNNVGKFTNLLRLTVEQNINAGPRSPDLIRLDLEAYEAGVLSKATVMTRLGIDDTNAEIGRIDVSTANILGILERLGTIPFTPESVILVMKELGLPEDILNLLEVPEVIEAVEPVVDEE